MAHLAQAVDLLRLDAEDEQVLKAWGRRLNDEEVRAPLKFGVGFHPCLPANLPAALPACHTPLRPPPPPPPPPTGVLADLDVGAVQGADDE